MAERRRRTIFDLMEGLRREMDRFFEGWSDEPSTPPLYDLERRALYPLSQITETEDEVIVTVDLPCVEKEDIKINATDDMVHIEARMRECVKLPLFRGREGDTEFQTFRRSLPLTVLVDPNEARARFRSGILEIRFPKRAKGSEVKID